MLQRPVAIDSSLISTDLLPTDATYVSSEMVQLRKNVYRPYPGIVTEDNKDRADKWCAVNNDFEKFDRFYTMQYNDSVLDPSETYFKLSARIVSEKELLTDELREYSNNIIGRLFDSITVKWGDVDIISFESCYFGFSNLYDFYSNIADDDDVKVCGYHKQNPENRLNIFGRFRHPFLDKNRKMLPANIQIEFTFNKNKEVPIEIDDFDLFMKRLTLSKNALEVLLETPDLVYDHDVYSFRKYDITDMNMVIDNLCTRNAQCFWFRVVKKDDDLRLPCELFINKLIAINGDNYDVELHELGYIKYLQTVKNKNSVAGYLGYKWATRPIIPVLVSMDPHKLTNSEPLENFKVDINFKMGSDSEDVDLTKYKLEVFTLSRNVIVNTAHSHIFYIC